MLRKLCGFCLGMVLLSSMACAPAQPQDPNSETSKPASSGGVSLTYKPPMVPISFTVDTNGNISSQIDQSIVTPLGQFTLGGFVESNWSSNSPKLKVIFRNSSQNLERVYELQETDKPLKISTDQKTDILLQPGFVIIEVGNVEALKVNFTPSDRSGSSGQVMLAESTASSDQAQSVYVQLEKVEVYEDGSAGATDWGFDISAGERSLTSIPRQSFHDDRERQVMVFNPDETTKLLNVKGDSLKVKVMGRNYDKDCFALGEAQISLDQLDLQSKSIQLFAVVPGNSKRGFFKFSFVVKPAEV